LSDPEALFQIGGWAFDSTQPNTAISVDVYDNGVLLTSPLANLFRQDLLNAGVGNGYHAYSIATPGSLKDGAPTTSPSISTALRINWEAQAPAQPSPAPATGPATSTITPTRSPASTPTMDADGVGSAGTSGYTSSDANGVR